MESDLPMIQVELGVDDHHTMEQRFLIIFGVSGKTLVHVRIPLLHRSWENVLWQSLEGARATMETNG